MKTTKKQLQEMIRKETRKQLDEQAFHLAGHDELEKAVDKAITRLMFDVGSLIADEDAEEVHTDLHNMVVEYLEGVVEP